MLLLFLFYCFLPCTSIHICISSSLSLFPKSSISPFDSTLHHLLFSIGRGSPSSSIGKLLLLSSLLRHACMTFFFHPLRLLLFQLSSLLKWKRDCISYASQLLSLLTTVNSIGSLFLFHLSLTERLISQIQSIEEDAITLSCNPNWKRIV